MSNFDRSIIELVESTARNFKAMPLNLGAVQGSGGGVGAPPGGYIGWLPQTRVAYDTDEAATLVTSVSGSILDNLNHIRYRLNILESGGSIIVTDDNNTLSYTDTTNLHFIGSGVVVTDLGSGDVQITINATGTGGGSGVFGSNEFYVDQSGGTSDTYGTLSGLVNSSNTLFGVSASGYVSGSLLVFLNGQLQTQGSSEDWVETTPSAGTFTFNSAPTSGDQLTAHYMRATTASGNADTLDGFHATSFRKATSFVTKTADYTVTSNDDIILCNNTTGITITLPPATGTGIIYNIKSINVGTVTVSGYSTQTIDGSNIKIINTTYDNLTILDGGAGTWYIL